MPKKRTGTLDRRLNKLSGIALDSLEHVLTDDSAKSSDRISAVKLTFDLIAKRADARGAESNGVIEVIIEGMDRELAQ